MHTYIILFDTFDEIKGCTDCPFCYDDLYCVAKSDNKPVIYPKVYRPDNCPMREIIDGTDVTKEGDTK